METVGLATTLIFTIPVGDFGLTLLANEQTAFSGAMPPPAVLMAALPEFLIMPQDLPLLAVERVVGGVVKKPGNKK